MFNHVHQIGAHSIFFILHTRRPYLGAINVFQP